jgi:tRNA threonylcarbamoyladenosine biosynthesis protein TsaB
MSLLAIETATRTARVAIVDASGARRAVREATADRHSSNLLRLCDEALREAGLTVSALDAIACGAGPGSFTGLRVGMAVAKGLALPAGTPLVLVSSLHALALDILEASAVTNLACACIDAGKGQVYAAFFRSHLERLVEPLSDEWVLNPGEIGARAPSEGSLVVAGNGAARYPEIIDEGLATRPGGGRRIDVAGPSADSVARLALLRLGRGESDDLAHAVPAYGRPPDITRPRRG